MSLNETDSHISKLSKTKVTKDKVINIYLRRSIDKFTMQVIENEILERNFCTYESPNDLCKKNTQIIIMC